MRFPFLVLAFIGLALGLCIYVARQRGVSIELSRNADANRAARALQANETLQRLAANPELKVFREETHHKPVMLCVISRHIVPALLKPFDAASHDDKPLLRQLDNVDVEPVLYKSVELPDLISEISAVQKSDPSQALAGDFNQLITALQKQKGEGFQIVFN